MSRRSYLRFEPRTAVLALGLALALVPLGALLTKQLVEGATDLTYTIHWLETVPLVVLAVAFLLNGLLNERREQREAKG